DAQGLYHVRLDRLPPPQTSTKYRSTPCPHAYETPNTTRKPDGAVIAQRRSASHVIAAKRSRPLKPFSRLSRTWGGLKPSAPRSQGACVASTSFWGKSSE